ncbi:hypothetical protein Slala05_76210 [Streptomyces lavendulae subsp. lavendulae]|nr:hypothetical protein Slala05_76210 [Streptomyces lavendulae subsp. lavendulae]
MADLLLTTRGRRSGLLRRTALAYVRDEDAYVLTASNAGADRHPAWYLNLLATPEVTLQVGAATFPATGRRHGGRVGPPAAGGGGRDAPVRGLPHRDDPGDPPGPGCPDRAGELTASVS